MSLTTFYAMIPHPVEALVFLISEGSQWRLPVIQGEEHYSNSAQFLRRTIHEQLGFDVTVLRWAAYRYDPQTDALSFFYAFENHSGGSDAAQSSIGAHGRWFCRSELETIPLLVPDHRAVILSWLAERKGEPTPSLRSPWAVPGWFDQARDWIAEQLAMRGERTAGDIEQIKVWQRSCVLKIPTTSGAAYFKAVPQGFRVEVLINEHLLQWFPEHAPDFIAIDTTRCWMLSRDVGGEPLALQPDRMIWQNAVRAYARLQNQSIAHVDTLVRLGCPQSPIEHFPAFIEDLIAHGYSFQAETPGALDAAEREKFFRFLPLIKEDCALLAACPVPSTLEHGDLNHWNILVAPANSRAAARGIEAQRMVFIDWSDSLITHPFLSLAPLFGFLDSVFRDPRLVQEMLVRAYLEEWRDYAAPEALSAAYHIASRLAWLNAALIMHRQVLPILEVPSEFAGTEALFLRFMLESYENYQATAPS